MKGGACKVFPYFEMEQSTFYLERISVYFRNLIFLSVIFLFTVNPAIANVVYNPNECEFSVEFPQEPTIYNIIIPEYGEVENAEFKGGSKPETGYFINAECIQVPNNAPILENPKEYLLSTVQQYAYSNGIQNAEFRFFEDNKGIGLVMRGYKEINGIPVIYSTMSLLGKKSLMNLRAGAAAKIYPIKEITAFFNSLK